MPTITFKRNLKLVFRFASAFLNESPDGGKYHALRAGADWAHVGSELANLYLRVIEKRDFGDLPALGRISDRHV